MAILTITTNKKREVLDITGILDDYLTKSQYEKGLCQIFATHTTCALTTADLDPGGTDQDYLDFLEGLTPKLNFRHPHNPEHVPDHIISSIIGTSITLPVENSNLVLGQWQKVILVELDGPRQRQIVTNFIPLKT